MTIQIVGIGGVSCAGKTTCTDELTRTFKKAMVVQQDDFYFSEDAAPRWCCDGVLTEHPDWDCVEALDVKAFVAEIKKVRFV